MTTPSTPPETPGDTTPTAAPTADGETSRPAADGAGPDENPGDDAALLEDTDARTHAQSSVEPAAALASSSELPWPLLARWMLIALALAFGAWGIWTALAPAPDDAATRLREQAARIETLQQQVATLTRSDQISRDANRDVQGTLAERDEEISALRADVAFYERFVGATGQRRGLTVHELQLQPQSDTAWHFTATLTQNLNRGAVSSGSAALSVEGMQDGKLKQLAWADLRQQPKAPGVDYSFKYFEQVEGDIALPPGFQPLRVSVRLAPQAGAGVERTFAWAAAAGAPGAG